MTVQRINSTRRGIPGDTRIRNWMMIGLLFTVLACQKTASMPSKIETSSAEEDSGFVFPRLDYYTRDDERTTRRKSSRQDNDVLPRGDIVFPNDESELSQTPSFTPGPAPECRTKTYCETMDFYPAKHVRNVIKERDDLQLFAGVDEVEDVVQRIGDDGTALCPTQERLVYPTAAQNREKNWLFVVNQDDFQQGVRVETCVSADSECAVISGILGGYKTMCKQKYILRQLVALTSNGTATRDMFKMPSSCCCYIKYDSLYSRMGVITNLRSSKKSSTSVSRRKRSLW